MKVIEVIVDSHGQSQIETKGFAGSACRDASKYLEQALGRRSVERVTGEFYHAETIQQQSRQSH